MLRCGALGERSGVELWTTPDAYNLHKDWVD